jgi:hypothetical protein
VDVYFFELPGIQGKSKLYKYRDIVVWIFSILSYCPYVDVHFFENCGEFKANPNCIKNETFLVWIQTGIRFSEASR